jgi:uncharacterized protein (TIGR00725 family)
MKIIKQVAVIGASDASEDERIIARKVGYLLAKKHIILLSGGRGGVMEASCQGSKEGGGLSVGIVPGTEGNSFLDIIIRTGMGQARNVILIESSDAVIAIGGGYGTLSEISFALKSGIPVLGLMTWNIPGIVTCTSAEEAVSGLLP